MNSPDCWSWERSYVTRREERPTSKQSNRRNRCRQMSYSGEVYAWRLPHFVTKAKTTSFSTSQLPLCRGKLMLLRGITKNKLEMERKSYLELLPDQVCSHCARCSRPASIGSDIGFPAAAGGDIVSPGALARDLQ